jgi:hypothetical protein
LKDGSVTAFGPKSTHSSFVETRFDQLTTPVRRLEIVFFDTRATNKAKLSSLILKDEKGGVIVKVGNNSLAKCCSVINFEI